jgi:hypothetical protein
MPHNTAASKHLRLLILLSILLTLLAWAYSAIAYDRLSYSRGSICIDAGLNNGVFFSFFSSSKPFTRGAKFHHESRSPPEFWPPASAPAPAHIWQGLGYLFRRFSDGWTFRIALPFWLLLLFSCTLLVYIRKRLRPNPAAFPILPLATTELPHNPVPPTPSRL